MQTNTNRSHMSWLLDAAASLWRRVLKALLHLMTGSSELVRVCLNSSLTPVARGVQIEESLSKSRQLQREHQHLQDLTSSVDAVFAAIQVRKGFPSDMHKIACVRLRSSLDGIHSYHSLIKELRELTRVTFDSSNAAHEEMLMELWTVLMPSEKLDARKSKRWSEIGFQGLDPATDFRGMGILGLMSLLFFAKTYPDISQAALRDSRHPVHWYSYAIVGINITSFVLELMRSKAALPFMLHRGPRVSLVDFYELYFDTMIQIMQSSALVSSREMISFHISLKPYVFFKFNHHWNASNPKSVMDFNSRFADVKETVRRQLHGHHFNQMTLCN